jgi:hypothetical protein
VKKK